MPFINYRVKENIRRVAFNEINIRGGLGTQLFGLASAYFRSQPLHFSRNPSIVLNIKNALPDAKINYVSAVFENTFQVLSRESAQKTQVFNSPYFLSDTRLFLEHRKKFILNKNQLSKAKRANAEKIGHVRFGVSHTGDGKIAKRNGSQLSILKVIAWTKNDPENRMLVTNSSIDASVLGIQKQQLKNLADPIEDWFTILNAREVWANFSTFSLSTLLFDPEKKMRVFYDQDADPEVHQDIKCLQECVKIFPNLTIEKL
ncbi:MAG: hypothetical protein VW124_22115 [Paracoccaceae bacterium]